eukprot:gene14618-19631_t
MAFVRSKYRAAPANTELVAVTEKSALSLRKKIKPVEEDPYIGIKVSKAEPPVYLASHTQKKRKELSVYSEEDEFRKKQYPTIIERVELQKKWAQEQLQEARMAQKREAIAQLYALQKQAELNKVAKDIENAAMKGNDKNGPDKSNQNDTPVVEFSIGDELDEEELSVMDELKQNDENYAEELMELQEKKLLATRNTKPYHQDITLNQKRILGLKVKFGFVPAQNKDYTIVAPWLLLGRRDCAENLQLLMKLNVTHILNVTDNLPNYHQSLFVYQRIKVKDSNEEDIAVYFETAVEFIQRAERAQGRIFVHCTAGSSRAPTIILAYLIAIRGIPLVDAYNYLTVLRPLVAPNNHFKFLLAKHEIDKLGGSSVFFHKDWRFYEFNQYRANETEPIQSKGLMTATMIINTKMKDDSDLLS